jgi:hypothetical protein
MLQNSGVVVVVDDDGAARRTWMELHGAAERERKLMLAAARIPKPPNFKIRSRTRIPQCLLLRPIPKI